MSMRPVQGVVGLQSGEPVGLHVRLPLTLGPTVRVPGALGTMLASTRPKCLHQADVASESGRGRSIMPESPWLVRG